LGKKEITPQITPPSAEGRLCHHSPATGCRPPIATGRRPQQAADHRRTPPADHHRPSQPTDHRRPPTADRLSPQADEPPPAAGHRPPTIAGRRRPSTTAGRTPPATGLRRPSPSDAGRRPSQRGRSPLNTAACPSADVDRLPRCTARREAIAAPPRYFNPHFISLHLNRLSEIYLRTILTPSLV
jgi:hypothetical protein